MPDETFDRAFWDAEWWGDAVYAQWAPCLMLTAAERMGAAGRPGGVLRVSLRDACRHFGVVLDEITAHHALADAMAAANLAIKMGMA